MRFALRLTVCKIQHIQGWRKSERHQMTSNWTWKLNSQKYSIYTEYLSLRPKFWSVLLYDWPFSRYRMYKVAAEISEMHRMSPTVLEHLTIKSTPYTLNTYPRGPNFGRFVLRLAVFNTQKYPIHPTYTLPRGPNFGPFRSTTSGFQDITRFIIPHWLPC